jgi:hypothetical protein
MRAPTPIFPAWALPVIVVMNCPPINATGKLTEVTLPPAALLPETVMFGCPFKIRSCFLRHRRSQKTAGKEGKRGPSRGGHAI